MKTFTKHNTKNTLRHWQDFQIKLVLEGIIVGFLSGLLIVFYRIAINKAESITKYISIFEHGRIWAITIWFFILVAGALIVGVLIEKDPMIRGSGIPQVEGVLLGHLNMRWWKLIIRKFAGGVIAIGAGLSLGREGPSIQLGSALGQGFSKLFKRIKLEEKYLITCGASAGLSAAFNAPLAGGIFALEEIHKNFSPLVLLSAMSASITADFVSKEFFGLKPIFQMHNLKALPLRYYLILIVLGAVLGILGAFYNYVLIGTQILYEKQKWLKVKYRPLIPFILAGVLGIVMPRVLGGGHELITNLFNSNILIKVLIITLVVKFIFSMISFGSGAPGGIFFPLLVLGALIGAIFGICVINIFHIDTYYINNFIILGMVGYFTAIVRAPITGIVLITEMTGSFTHLLALTVVAIVSYVVADALGSKPIYESLLDRIIKNKSIDKFEGDSNIKTIVDVIVHHGCYLENKRVKEFMWPSNCLLVSIRRSGKEIIPKGNTKINAGDLLVVLTNEKDSVDVTASISEVCNSNI